MTPQSTGVRAVILLAVALLAAAGALALTRHNNQTNLPAGSPHWYSALAAPYLSTEAPTPGACSNVMIGPKTRGVAHPVLPCGVKIYIEFNGKQVLTQVIDRGPKVPGRTFDVTQALARDLGLVGTRRIRWRYTTR